MSRLLDRSNKKGGLWIVGLLIILTIIFLIALGPFLKMQDLVTLILVPALTLIALLHENIKSLLNSNSEFLALLLIFLLSVMTIYYYEDYPRFIDSFRVLLGAVMAAYIPVGLHKNRNYSTYFHIGYILAILILISIMYLSGNFSFSNFASKVDFRDRFLLNANAYSYYSFFANFSLFYLYERYKSKILLLLLLALPVLFIIVSFVTQSRSGLLLIILINFIYWFVINKPKQLSQINKIKRNLVLLIIGAILTFQFIQIYEGSRIKNRVERSVSSGDSRGQLAIEGIEAFIDNPIFGVGLGQLPLFTTSGQFSHNSYIEIFAEQGILGGVLLLFLFGLPLYKSYNLYSSNKDNSWIKLNLLFFLTFYIFNNAYPFYKFPFSMMYFFLIVSLQNKVYSDAIDEKIS